MAISVSLLDYLEDEQEKNRTSEQNSREKNNIRCVAIYIRNCKFVVDSMVGLEMREIRNIINHMAAAFFSAAPAHSTFDAMACSFTWQH